MSLLRKRYLKLPKKLASFFISKAIKLFYFYFKNGTIIKDLKEVFNLRKKIGLISASIAMGALVLLGTHPEEAQAKSNNVGTATCSQNLDFAAVSYYFDDTLKTYSGEAEDITLTTDQQQVTFSFTVSGEKLEFKGSLYFSSRNSSTYILETMNGETSAITMTLSVQKIDANKSYVKLRSGSTIMDHFFDTPHIKPTLDTIVIK